ncbi:hypothetical protein M885DRAFT_523575 [Pelagophyceae sp. CCMP2097]|nr:hypothetical protein M885DRAFT_523575 [Pelagophyceae sp. CCMP2097]
MPPPCAPASAVFPAAVVHRGRASSRGRRVRTMDDIDIDEDEEAELDDAVAPERRAATPGGDGPRSTGRRADERSPSSARSAAGSPAPWPPPCADRGAQRGRWPDWLTAAQRWVATHLAQEAGAKTHLSKVRAAFAASGDFPSEDVALFADLENARSDASKSFKSRALQPHVGAGGICDKVSIRGVNQIGLVGWRLADRSEALQADEALVADEAKRADERRRSAAGRLAPSQENDDETQDETPDETQECAAPDAEIRDAEMRDVRDEAPPPPPPPEEPPRAPPAALVAGFAPATPAAASAPTPAAAAAPTSATPARPRDSISSASAAEAQEPETQERPQVWKNTAPSPIDSVSEA